MPTFKCNEGQPTKMFVARETLSSECLSKKKFFQHSLVYKYINDHLIIRLFDTFGGIKLLEFVKYIAN